jgi:putative DNA primase/helicase
MIEDKPLTKEEIAIATAQLIDMTDIKAEEETKDREDRMNGIYNPFRYIRKKKIGIEYLIDVVVADLLEKFKFKTIYGKVYEEVWFYNKDEGYWQNEGKRIIKTETEKMLGKYCKNNPVIEVFEKIKRLTDCTMESFNCVPEEMLCLKNGVLNVETRELLPFDERYNFKSCIPVCYEKDAKCPHIDQFLEDTFYPDDIPIIEEWLGFHLYKKHFIKKALIIFGPKNTGKTQFINLLIAFIGDKNKTGISLHSISAGDKFTLSFLKDKLGNVYDDLSFKDLQDAGGFKIATGGGYVSAEYKFGDSFEFLNYAKNTFATNKIPVIEGESDDAYYLRWLPIPCDNEVPVEEQDTFLIKKMTSKSELSGLLNRALDGLGRLLKTGRFSFNKTTAEIKDIMERHSNQLVSFARECLQEADGERITKEEMYEVYRAYASDKGMKIYSKNQLGRRLDKVVPYMTSKHEKERYWENVRINPNYTSLINLLAKLRQKQEELKI